MIVGIYGKVLKKEPTFCDILTSGGVIYRLIISISTYSALENEANLITKLVVRDDAMVLFGFATNEEKELFEMLIKVSGVGPKSAMAILSSFAPSEFLQVVANQDDKSLTKVPGIGKKTASLILVQLTGKLDSITTSSVPNHAREASLALESLGFKPADIAKVLAKCTSKTTPEIVKEALQFFRK